MKKFTSTSWKSNAASLAVMMAMAITMPKFERAAETHAATFSWNQGDGTWDGVSLKWAPLIGGPPAAGDDALLGDRVVANNAVVMLGTDTGTLNSLEIMAGVDLASGGFDGEAIDVAISGSGSRLIVEDRTWFDNNDGATTVTGNGQLLVEDGGSYSGGEVTLSGGDAQLTGGTLGIRANSGNGFLNIESGSALTGWGLVDFGDAGVISGDLLVNNGEIRTSRTFPDFGQRLELVLDFTHPGESDALIDLDGSTESGSVSVAHTTTLSILGTLADTYSSTIDMNSGSILDISQPWSLGSGSLVEVDAIQAFPFVPSTFARIEGGTLTALSGSTLNVNSGKLEIDADFVANVGSKTNVADNATLQFDGIATINDTEVIDLGSDSPTLVIGGDTTIQDTSGGFDWDGQGGTTTHAATEVREGASLTIDVGQFDDNAEPLQYDGTLTIDSGTVDVRVDNNASTPWIMERTLNLNNTNGTAPVLSGNPIEVGNDSGTFDAAIQVGGTGVSRVTADVAFQSDASVDISGGATLDLDGDVEWAGGQYAGDGVLDPGLNNRVTSSTTIGLSGTNTLTVDLDEGDWEIDSNQSLTLNVAAVDATDTGFDNDITLGDGGKLAVHMPADAAWRYEFGQLHYQGSGAMSTFLGGDPVEFRHQATVDVDGSGRMAARVELGGDVNINDAGEQLELSGGSSADPNRLEGGTIQGNGELVLPAGRALAGHGDVDVDVSGGGALRADDGTMNVRGSVSGLAILGTADTDGVLNLDTSILTSDLTDAVELRGGTVTGEPIANDGETRGHGRIATLGFATAGVTAADRGTLVIDSVNPADIDGRVALDGQGVLLAVDGDIEVATAMTDTFSGTLEVGAGRTFSVTRPGAVFRNAAAGEDEDLSGDYGRIDLVGGTLVAPTFQQASQLRAAGTTASTIDATSIAFDNGSLTEILDPAGELHLVGEAVVRPAAIFTGPGTLVNDDGSALAIADAATINVATRNEGILQIGATVGEVRMRDFEQSSTGSLEVGLAGHVAGLEYDVLDLSPLSGIASLDGTLDVSLLGGFAPSIGDVFEILRAPGGVTGTFATEALPAPATGLAWNVVYNPTDVLLELMALLAADFDEDGDVDGADFLIWQNGFGLSSGAMHSDGDADGDGDVDGNDFLSWQNEFGSASGGGALAAAGHGMAAVPEPASLGLMVLAVCAAVGTRRSRSR